MRIKDILIVIAILLLLIACTAKEDPLIFATIPAEDAALTKKQWQPTMDYLSTEIGRQIELVTVSDYTATIEALKYGHADIGRLSVAGYVTAIDEGVAIEVFVTAVKEETGLPGYTAVLIAAAGTDTTDMSSLTFAFVDVGSTSGYVVPSIYLEENSITPRESMLAGSHQAVILAVRNGSVDIGATCTHRLEEAIKQGIIDRDEIVVVWQSEIIPNVPIVFQSSMDQELKDKLRNAFLNMPQYLIEAIAVDETHYVEARDEDYDPIRDIIHYQSQ